MLLLLGGTMHEFFYFCTLGCCFQYIPILLCFRWLVVFQSFCSCVWVFKPWLVDLVLLSVEEIIFLPFHLMFFLLIVVNPCARLYSLVGEFEVSCGVLHFFLWLIVLPHVNLRTNVVYLGYWTKHFLMWGVSFLHVTLSHVKRNFLVLSHVKRNFLTRDYQLCFLTWKIGVSLLFFRECNLVIWVTLWVAFIPILWHIKYYMFYCHVCISSSGWAC